MSQIAVNLGSGSYSITIERGVLARLGEFVRAAAPHARAMLAVDEKIAGTHGAVAEQSLRDAGYQVVVHHLTADEAHKTLDAVQAMYAAMLSAKLERGSPVIALGGGVVGDTAGFAAATYLRGVPLVQVPTTLLAMVDAAIGGKTGVNLRLPNSGVGGGLGKNLVGAFWQPRAVLADPEVLRTLGPRDFRCGLAECVKHGMIADASLLQFIGENAERIAALDMNVLTDLIARSAPIKVGIVQEDERESVGGRRVLLNLGHTFAHAIEPIAELDLRHGEAVAIGLIAAMRCAVDLRRMTTEEAGRVQQLLAALGLPIRLSRPAPIQRVLSAMGYDKKVQDGRLRLVLPAGLGRAEIVDDVPEDLIRDALHEIGAIA